MTSLNLFAKQATGRNGDREEKDFYPTPPWVTEELLKRETFGVSVWEPACGKGDISDVLKKHGYPVYSSDLHEWGYGDSGVDFLMADNIELDSIVTNPPFSLAMEFVLKAKIHARMKVAMFLKTAFLEGKARYHLFKDENFPLAKVYQFSGRVSFGRHAGTHTGRGMIPFAWFVWDKNHVGLPQIDWIK